MVVDWLSWNDEIDAADLCEHLLNFLLFIVLPLELKQFSEGLTAFYYYFLPVIIQVSDKLIKLIFTYVAHTIQVGFPRYLVYLFQILLILSFGNYW